MYVITESECGITESGQLLPLLVLLSRSLIVAIRSLLQPSPSTLFVSPKRGSTPSHVNWIHYDKNDKTAKHVI